MLAEALNKTPNEGTTQESPAVPYKSSSMNVKCTVVKHETVSDKSSDDIQEMSSTSCFTGSKFDEEHTQVKEELLENPAFLYQIPKSEELLLEDEIIIKEERQDCFPNLMPPPTEEIYIKDEFLQPSFSSTTLKGVSKLNNMYVCDVCQYESMDVMKLKTHIVLHIKEKPYKCFECDYEISTKFDLTLHILNEHSEIFRCTQCKFTTVVPHEMEHHMMIHNVEETEHMKILAAEKPFKCKHCEYRASKEYFLKKHVVKHSPENCFKCNECSFNCLLKTELQGHMKTHRKRKRN